MEAMLLPYKRYAEFDGRSTRSEYWLFHLLYLLVVLGLISIGAILVDGFGAPSTGGPGIIFNIFLGLAVLFVLGSLVPSIAVTVRRFHDLGYSGWMYLISFIPYIGGLIVFVFMCMRGTDGPNQYGDDPLNPSQNVDVFS